MEIEDTNTAAPDFSRNMILTEEEIKKWHCRFCGEGFEDKSPVYYCSECDRQGLTPLFHKKCVYKRHYDFCKSHIDGLYINGRVKYNEVEKNGTRTNKGNKPNDRPGKS